MRNLPVFLPCSQPEVDCKDIPPGKLVGEGVLGLPGDALSTVVPCPEHHALPLAIQLAKGFLPALEDVQGDALGDAPVIASHK